MRDFQLIETMRWETGTGILRLSLHMARLRNSANTLGFAVPSDLERRLSAALPEHAKALRVRLALGDDGELDITTAPFVPLPENTVWRVRIAPNRLNSNDPLLRHKTTLRSAYETARSAFSQTETDEVLLCNERDELCEGTITSLFVDDGSGFLKTPPLSCGLLAGVLRTELICRQRTRVARLKIDDLLAGKLYVGNSLRGLIRAELQR